MSMQGGLQWMACRLSGSSDPPFAASMASTCFPTPHQTAQPISDALIEQPLRPINILTRLGSYVIINSGTLRAGLSKGVM